MKKTLLFTLYMGVIVITALVVDQAQEVAPPVKFALSEVENLKLENLRLSHQLTICELNSANGAYSEQLNKYVKDTLTAHGLPKNVTFDSTNLKWVVTQEQKLDNKEKEGTK